MTKKPRYTGVDEYIASFPAGVRKSLRELRKLVRRLAPGVEEKIAYGMPTFSRKGNLVSFAAYATHIGLYPVPKELKRVAGKYMSGKGTARFPLEEPLPVELVKKIVEHRLKADRRRGGK